MDIMFQNETSKNLLVLKLLWAALIGGFGVSTVLNFAGLADTRPEALIFGFIIGLGLVAVATVLWRFYAEKSFMKYIFILTGVIMVTVIISLSGEGFSLSPLWFSIVVVASMYFSVPLILFSVCLCYIANLVMVLYMPGPGLEDLPLETFIGQPGTLIVAFAAVAFTVREGKKLMDLIINSEAEANRMKQDMGKVLDNSQKAAVESSSVSEALSDSTESISASIQEIASTTNEFASSVMDLARMSANMAEVSRETSTRASQGGEEVEGALNQIDVIREVIEKVQHSVEGLVEKTKKIGKKIASINDISDQTNLLALNAAIEAARAGTHGKGFAVVADEVRKLSEQTASTAQDITVIVNENEKESELTMQEIMRGTEQIKSSSGVIENTGTNFKAIIDAVESVTGQIEEIAANVEKLKGNSENLASITEEQSASVTKLNELAGNLRKTSRTLSENLEVSNTL